MRDTIDFDLLNEQPVEPSEERRIIVLLGVLWRYAREGSRLCYCNGCDRPVGVNAEQWKCHVEDTGLHPIFCVFCAAEFQAWYRGQMEQCDFRGFKLAPAEKTWRVQ
jgi:hypothetical protein